MSRVRLSTHAIYSAKQLDLSPGAVEVMVEQAAPVTHPKGNRRYEEYVFAVKDGIVHEVSLFASSCTGEDMQARVYDCPVCERDGKHCMECGGKGTVIMSRLEYDSRFGGLT